MTTVHLYTVDQNLFDAAESHAARGPRGLDLPRRGGHGVGRGAIDTLGNASPFARGCSTGPESVPVFGQDVFGTFVMLVTGFSIAVVSGELVGMIRSPNNPISGVTLSTTIIAALVVVRVGGQSETGLGT